MKSSIKYVSPHVLAGVDKGTPVLLALSGGADSSALLHLLVNDAKNLGFPLYVAHFNHKIRGNEAERDALFCENLAKKHSLSFFLGSADIPALAKESGRSIEGEARERRYEFFAKIMAENGIPLLATAHHAEDNIESIILHMLRGSGIGGLVGMEACRDFYGDFKLTRPLLCAEKHEILEYVKENGIEFVTDSTNDDESYARNAIRAQITPAMRSLQPNLTQIFSRMSQNLAVSNDFINTCALDFINSECQNAINIQKFNTLHPALKSRVLSLEFAKVCDGTLEFIHTKELISLCERAIPHSSLSLPSKMRARVESGGLIFESDLEEAPKNDFKIPFFVGSTTLEDGTIINIVRNPTENPTKDEIYLDVKLEHVGEDTHFRSRRDGDTIFSGKMNKKVKKLFCEHKIPLDMRDRIPLLISNNEILWIPTLCACDKLKRDKINDESFYRITIKFVK